MNGDYSFRSIPASRIATFDIFSIGLKRHHVSALLEFDVTESRNKLRELRKKGIEISFNAWLIKIIGTVLSNHPESAAYIFSKRKLIIFNDINISILVEKNIGGNKVPVPVVIEKANQKSAFDISREIENAKKSEVLSAGDIVINRQTDFWERMYYHMPGFIRREVWKFMVRNPRLAYRKMGNAVITSVGMMGKINGWFIQRSVHPISFGIGSVLKKAVVVDNEIMIREILNMTILIDHDVIDGAPMVRLLNELTRSIENLNFNTGQKEMNLSNCSTALFVRDILVSRRFYTEILGFSVQLDFGKNIIFSCGFAIWEIQPDHIIPLRLGTNNLSDKNSNRFELYFETETLEQDFLQLKKLNVRFLNEIHEEPWGQRTIRFFDPDNHLIEIGESMHQFVLRLYHSGLSIEEVNRKTSVPVEEITRLLKK